MDIKDMKRGEWMPGDLKPDVPGVWEREYLHGELGFCKFSDGIWYVLCDTAEEAAKIKDPSCNQNLRWRGQLEYDPHNAPSRFVAVLTDLDHDATLRLDRPCSECDLAGRVECIRARCHPSMRIDGRTVIMVRAKP